MKEMTFVEHLEELRSTLIRVLVILAVSFVLCYAYGEVISELLLQPLRHALSADSIGQVVYLGILDKVLAQFQVAFWSSVIISSPFWFYELWRFVKPGLYDHEVKAVKPFLLLSFFFFCAGVSFGYFIVFPFTFDTLLGFGVQDAVANISLKDYLILTSKVLVFLGIMFQLPNLLLILGFMGLVTKYSLKNFRPYIYVIFAIISSVLTPPDVITMMALWTPLVVLFEIGVVAVAFIVHPYLERHHK